MSGVKICNNAPTVSHLFFVDDVVLLMKANQSEAEVLKEILDLYKRCFGQCINTEKSAIMFTPNTRDEVRTAVKNALVIHSENWNEKYLGLPVHVGQSKRKAFAYIKGSVAGKVYGWKEKLIAKPGKEVLVKIVAQYDSKGAHSVKSTYKLQVKLDKPVEQGDVGSSSAATSTNQGSDDSWTRLWKLPGPRNIQMFAWRLKHESLALRSNLKKRGIRVEDTKCLFCGRAEEDGGHLFIKCKYAKVVWKTLELEKERRDLKEIPSVHHALDYIWRLSEIKRLHIRTFWWLWWSNRNKLREGELPEPAEEVARRTRANVLEYLQIFRAPNKGKCPTRWRPPPGDMIKINADGSFIPGQDGSGWGVVARDATREVIAARAGRRDHAHDAFTAEVYALSHAISVAADIGVVRVIFEADSMLLMEAMDLSRVDASAYAAVIEDLKYQLKIWFSKHKITVCRREAKSAAHQLASIGRMYETNHFEEWENLVPAQVAACVEGDFPLHRYS
ncbi:hypothetical protein D1007_54235 [Hordeum vulgare]|nr:hypothetical protein D1007_54235 [Hordeum vulgare]